MTLRYIICIIVCSFVSLTGCAVTKGEAKTILEKGKTLYRTEQYSEATDLYLEAMNKAQKSGDSHTYAEGLYQLGMVYVRMDDIERAMFYFQQCYDKANEIDNKKLQGMCVAYMASCCAFSNQLAKAKHYYAIQKTLPNDSENLKQFYLLYNGALISFLEKRIGKAQTQLHLAVDCVRKHNLDEKYLQSVYGLLVYIQIGQKNIDKALQYCEEYRLLTSNKKKRLWQEAYYEMLCDVYNAAGDSCMAKVYRDKADSTFNTRIAGQHIKAIDNKVVKFESKRNKEDINKLNVTVNRQWQMIVVAMAFVLLLILFVVVVVVKNRRLKHAYKLVIARNNDLVIADRMSKKLRQKSNTGAGNIADVPAENISESDVILSQEQIDDILQRVVAVMENIEIISNPSFNLVMLAQLAESNTRYVSWVINNTYHKNFKTLLNEYRIREVCRRMEDKETYGHLTIQAIYNSLGYSSASNFLRAFKNVNGMTPSTYQKLIDEKKNGRM